MEARSSVTDPAAMGIFDDWNSGVLPSARQPPILGEGVRRAYRCMPRPTWRPSNDCGISILV